MKGCFNCKKIANNLKANFCDECGMPLHSHVQTVVGSSREAQPFKEKEKAEKVEIEEQKVEKKTPDIELTPNGVKKIALRPVMG